MSYVDEIKIAKTAENMADYISTLDAEERDEAFYMLIVNAVCYAVYNNHTKTNFIARDLFNYVVPEDYMKQMFDET